jgi:bifunctional UDP-N-acetylglucosamine pyrophosphorylase/glucosamine-1-phosphate N-acetyltransferase
MRRVLIIPAAGAGTRLNAGMPKLLVPVNGRAMIDWLIDLYAPFVESIALVLAPDAVETTRAHFAGNDWHMRYFVQDQPTGMLDAVLIPRDAVVAEGADVVWVTWADQVAIHPRTVARLAELEHDDPAPDLWFPIVHRRLPYTHLDRGEDGVITRVLHRREGDAMPETGDSEAGLFAMRAQTYRDRLPEFAGSVVAGTGTAERNFLPFIPWMATHGVVRTFPAVDELEAVGINTREELAEVEEYLRRRQT